LKQEFVKSRETPNQLQLFNWAINKKPRQQ
jgi:hypothetical protein